MSTPTAATSPTRPPTLAVYAKFFVHLAASVVGLALAAASDGLSPTEAGQLVLLLAGTALVYTTANGDGLISGHAKAVLAWLVTLLTAVVPVIGGGWADLASNTTVVLIAAAGALGVGVTPNAGTTSLGDAVRSTLEQVRELRGQVATVQAVQQVQQPAPAAGATYTGQYLGASPATTASGRLLVTSSGSGAPARAAAQQPPVTAGAQPAPDALSTGVLDAVTERAAPLRLDS